MTRLLLLLIALAVPTSALAVPFVLPESESIEAWRAALEFAQFEAGPAAAGPYAELSRSAEGWRLTVRDVDGATREVAVAEPSSAASREEIASLAFSLLQPSNLPGSEPSDAPEEEEAPDEASADPVAEDEVPAEEVPDEPVAEEPITEEVPGSEESTSAEVSIDRPPVPGGIRVGGWITAAGGVDFRQRVRVGAFFEVGGGVALGAGFRLGAQVSAKPPSRLLLPARDAAVVATSWDLGVGAVLRWTPDLPVGPVLGVGVGALRRAHLVDRAPVGAFWHARLAVDAGLSIRVAPWARIEPMAQFQFDLVPSHPLGEPRADLPPIPVFGLAAGLAVTISSPR